MDGGASSRRFQEAAVERVLTLKRGRRETVVAQDRRVPDVPRRGRSRQRLLRREPIVVAVDVFVSVSADSLLPHPLLKLDLIDVHVVVVIVVVVVVAAIVVVVAAVFNVLV